MGDGRSPIATREIYTTPKNQIKMQNRMPSRVDAFVYKTRVTTNVWRSGARIPLTRQYLVANTRTGEASRASSTSNADTRRDAVGDLSEGSRGDRLVRWLEEPKHLSTFFLSFFFFWVFLRQRRRWPADSGLQCGHLDNTKESQLGEFDPIAVGCCSLT